MNRKFRVGDTLASSNISKTEVMEEKFNIDWPNVLASLNLYGFALIRSSLSEKECAEISDLYSANHLFRSTVNMQRYRFGLGEYKYLNYPLPPPIQSLREEFYVRLAPVANDWMGRLGIDILFPEKLEEFLSHCRSKDQKRPTPLLLRYEENGYNTLHQDIYGDVFFPFQVVFMLKQPGRDFDGGELVFVEQLPRAQSRAEVLNPNRGDAVIFTTNFRPVKGSRG